MKRILIAAFIPVAISIAGCGSFYAEAEQPQVCLTVAPQTFTIFASGGTAPPEGYQGAFSGQVDVGLGEALPDFLLNGRPEDHILRFQSLEASITTSSGAANFDWLEDLSLKASNGLASQQLAFYAGGLPAGSRVLRIEAMNADNNLITYLANGNMVLNLEGSVAVPGSAPIPASFTATVKGCFSAKVRKTLDEMINGN